MKQLEVGTKVKIYFPEKPEIMQVEKVEEYIFRNGVQGYLYTCKGSGEPYYVPMPDIEFEGTENEPVSFDSQAAIGDTVYCICKLPDDSSTDESTDRKLTEGEVLANFQLREARIVGYKASISSWRDKHRVSCYLALDDIDGYSWRCYSKNKELVESAYNTLLNDIRKANSRGIPLALYDNSNVIYDFDKLYDNTPEKLIFPKHYAKGSTAKITLKGKKAEFTVASVSCYVSRGNGTTIKYDVEDENRTTELAIMLPMFEVLEDTDKSKDDATMREMKAF